jgi:hypothetical protein
MFIKSVECLNSKICISFKFFDPEKLNGQLTNFNLYQVNLNNDSNENNKSDLKLIYSGLQRDYLFMNLKAFKNYSFIYELCTFAGCTRQLKPQSILTLELLPKNQSAPIVSRIINSSLSNGNINALYCFSIKWMLPEEPNGLILYFELNKVAIANNYDDFSTDIQSLIDNNMLKFNVTLLKSISYVEALRTNFIYVDCDLKENFYYLYRIVSVNRRGRCESNLSTPLISRQSLPTGFENIYLSIRQLNQSLVIIEWNRPKYAFSHLLIFNIYRNSVLIHTRNVHGNNKNSPKKFTFLDMCADFLPNMAYNYKMYVCNEAGCQTNERLLSLNLVIDDQPPFRVDPPKLLKLESRSAFIEANKSIILKSPHTQKVVEYRFYLNSSLISKSSQSYLNLISLLPFTIYEVSLEACTFLISENVGCTKSYKSLVFQTNQSTPDGLDFFNIKDLPNNEYSLNLSISWSSPKLPNGILRFLRLKRDEIEIFATNNMKIMKFIDYNLKYGMNYTYELIYFNDHSFVSLKKLHYTVENVPQFLLEPKCGSRSLSDISLAWLRPLYTNGVVNRYEIRYKNVKQLKWESLIMNCGDEQSEIIYKLEGLIPFETYEFQLGACNRIGCAFSNVVSENNCTQIDNLPQFIPGPVLNELLENENSSFYSNSIQIIIMWSFPINNTIPIKVYKIYRTLVYQSISFDENFNPMNSMNDLGKVIEIYRGRNLSFVDMHLRAASIYDYFIEQVNNYGSRLSPVTRFKTRPKLPANILKIGSILNLTNQSVSLNIKPPLNLNGAIQNISVLIKTPNDYFYQERLIYSIENIKPNAMIKLDTGSKLVIFLNKISIDNLKPNQFYELRTKFCNEIGCIQSEDTIEFQTYENDKLDFFRANEIKSNSFKLVWSFKHGNPFAKRNVKYKRILLSLISIFPIRT